MKVALFCTVPASDAPVARKIEPWLIVVRPLTVFAPERVCVPVPVLTSAPVPEMTPAKSVLLFAPPSVSVPLPSCTAPLPARLPIVALNPARFKVPVVVCVTAALPVVAPVSVIAAAFDTGPFTVPRIAAVAPALLLRPPPSVPVDVRALALVTRPEIVPALARLALFSTAPARLPVVAIERLPWLTVVRPAKLFAPPSVSVPVPVLVKVPEPEMMPSKLVEALLPPAVSAPEPSWIAPVPAMLPSVVLKPARLRLPPAFWVKLGLPDRTPVSVMVPELVIAPLTALARLAVAPALLTNPPASVPVEVSVPELVTSPVVVPALMKVALFCNALANDVPVASTSEPWAISVEPRNVLVPESVWVPVPVFTSTPLPVIVPAKSVLVFALPSVKPPALISTWPVPARLPMLVLTLVRLNTPPRFCVNAPIPVVAPVSVNVPLLVIALPPKLPATFAVAPALLVSPPASVPVLVSVPALVTRPLIVPALLSVALFCTAPAIVPPLASDSVPPLTVVSPA